MHAPRIWRKLQSLILQAPATMPDRPGRPRRRATGRFELFTAIGRDLALNTSVASDGPVIVAGTVGGGVSGPWVEIDREACVRGIVKADNAIIQGEVAGNVYGRNISLGASARVSGEIVCERLHAAPGAVVGGRTHPSIRLNGALSRDLARIARDARAAHGVDPGAMEALLRDGLIFERGGAVFVSIFGFLELNRNWTRSIGLSPHRTRELHLESLRPPEVAAYRKQVASVPLSVIGDDVRLACDLETRGDIRIHGEVRGRVVARCCMTGDASRIDGSIAAGTAQLAGYVCGPVSAGNLLLLRTACIEGPVNFGTIEARGGARYDVGRQSAQPDDANVSQIGKFLAGLQKAA